MLLKVRFNYLRSQSFNSGPIVKEAKKKSLDAWTAASQAIALLQTQDPHDEMNEALSKAAKQESHNDKLDEAQAPPAEREKLKQRREHSEQQKPASEKETQELKEKGARSALCRFATQ